MEKIDTIKIRSLTTGYISRGKAAVVTGGVTACLRSGELTCLLGPNGAGKSTLLRTLSGFLPPLEGEIELLGRPLGDYSERELAKIVGVVLTDRIQSDNMTARELVALGRTPYTGFWGTLSDKDNRAVDGAMALVRIESLAPRAVATLSDGERQKVMIAKALAQETPVIFLDEPTAFLDYPSKVEIMQLLHRLSRVKGKTVFMSTHDLELALQISDRAWLIDKTLGVVTGCPEDLAFDGRLARYFEYDGVRFDPATGLFGIDVVPAAEIRVTGSGPRYNMVRKALARNGIVPSQSARDIIEVTSDGPLLLNGVPVNDISSMLDKLYNV